MASPGEKKGQRNCLCGHIMAGFDSHDKCTRCRNKHIGEDNYDLDKPCPICDALERTRKRACLYLPRTSQLVVLWILNQLFNHHVVHLHSLLHSLPVLFHLQWRLPLLLKLLDLLHQSSLWLKQFARMEALLSRGNIFHYSIPVSTVKPVESQHLISETPFMPPATRPTGPVQVPVAVEASVKPKTVTKTAESKDSHKDRKKSHKSRKSDLPTEKDTKPDKKADKKRDSKSQKT